MWDEGCGKDKELRRDLKELGLEIHSHSCFP